MPGKLNVEENKAVQKKSYNEWKKNNKSFCKYR